MTTLRGASQSGWFYCREARPDLWLIAEPGHVCTWLILGTDRACLFDTGTGMAPIRPLVEAITPLPVVVVNSHYHFDHTGGNHEFDLVAVHRAGIDELSNDRRPALVNAYLDMVEGWDDEVEAFRKADSELFGLLTAEFDPRKLPAQARANLRNSYTARQPAAVPLRDGSRIDLGGRTLEVVHTPGHSPDGISLLDSKNRLLLTGDAFNLGLVYCHFFDSNLSELKSSAQRLRELSADVDFITAHHYPRVIAEPNLLDAYVDALARLHEQESKPTLDIFGQPCRVVSFDQVAVTIPDPASPPAYVG